MPVKSGVPSSSSPALLSHGGWCEKRGSYEGPLSLGDVLAELHAIFAEEEVDVERVRGLLNAYHSDPNDWRKYAIYDPHR